MNYEEILKLRQHASVEHVLQACQQAAQGECVHDERVWALWADGLEQTKQYEMLRDVGYLWTQRHPYSFQAHLHTLRRDINVCNWQRYAYLQHYMLSPILKGEAYTIGETSLAAEEFNLQLLSLCAKRHGQHLKRQKTSDRCYYARYQFPDIQNIGNNIGNNIRKIKVGFLGGDFSSQATSYLMVGMVENHTRSQFEYIAYDFGHDDGSPLRQRILKGFDRYVLLEDNLSHEAVAARIAQDALDILIFIRGLGEPRLAALAYRPAALQLAYLYYPGPMTCDCIDGFIADEWVIPKEQESVYEHPIYRLPRCYQPNDSLRIVGQHTVRENYRLPQEAFVFANFNTNYKITPAMFQVWCEILHRCPNSVLWLMAANEMVAKNLQREAYLCAIDARRLVLAPILGDVEHLTRLQCVDVLLDTYPYGGHTGTSDALWAGSPVLSLCAEVFASRVAGSLLHSVGLDEFIATDKASYIEKACYFYHRPQRVKEVKSYLVQNRHNFELFNAKNYAQDFEALLKKILKTLNHPLGEAMHFD